MNSREGLREVNEILLFSGTKSITIPPSTQEQIETFQHGLGVTPYVDYQISLDGGTTYLPPYNGEFGNDNRRDMFLYTDGTNLYFHYLYSTTPIATAVSYTINYKLYVTEFA